MNFRPNKIALGIFLLSSLASPIATHAQVIESKAENVSSEKLTGRIVYEKKYDLRKTETFTCGNPARGQALSRTYTREASEKVSDSQEALLKFSAGLGIGAGPNSLAAQFENTMKNYYERTSSDSTTDVSSLSIPRMACFNQEVSNRYIVENTGFSGQVKGTFLWSDVNEFHTKAYFDRIAIKAIYDQSCSEACKINDRAAVKGKNDEPIMVKITDDETDYFVPLFWDKDKNEGYWIPIIKNITTESLPVVYPPNQASPGR